ncbi:MAG: hypothetical protein IPJ16_11460 [Bacteroidales bacterium]|nr:hypothetical protein [Bacteroidales bacterium]
MKVHKIIMINFGKQTNLNWFEMYVISITILLYLFRPTIPVLKFPLLVSMIGLMFYALYTKKKNIAEKASAFFKEFYIVLSMVFLLFITFFLSNKLYLSVFKDLINSISLLVLFFLMSLIINSKDGFNCLLKRLLNLIIFTTLILSIGIIYNFFDVYQAPELIPNLNSGFKFQTLLTTDYNFILLPVFFGIISSLIFLREADTAFERAFFDLIVLINSICVLLSGSRRGLITLSLILIILLGYSIKTIFNKSAKSKKYLSHYSFLTIFIVLFVFITCNILFNTSEKIKDKFLHSFGLEDNILIRQRVAIILTRYISAGFNDITYYDTYNRIWDSKTYESLSPENGWGNINSKIIYPLTGSNSEIVPPGAKGYMLDSTSASIFSNGSAVSQTLFKTVEVKKGDIISASVYCYVSDSFNGNSVSLSSSGATFGNTETKYKIYDPLTYNETETESLLLNGDFSMGTVYWALYSDSTTHKIVKTPFGNGIRISRTNGNGVDWSLRYTGKSIIYYAGHKYLIKFLFKVHKGTDVPFRIGWWVSDGNSGYEASSLPLDIKKLENGWNEAVCSYTFKETHTDLISFLNSLQDYSIVDIANVEIIDLNSNNKLPKFAYSENEDKGRWQKLTIYSNCDDGEASIFLNISKFNVYNFSSLKGYVIFAYPKYEIIRLRDSLTHNISIYDSNQFKANLLPSIPPLIMQYLQIVDKDPIRRWSSLLIAEDTTYFSYRKNLYVTPSYNKFIGDRIMRWQFAVQIYCKEYNWKQKIFGGGFNFLNWFGYRFLNDKTASDYPHNPFLSVLLYSGIIGLLIYLVFFYRAVSYYIKYRREYPILFLFFSITFLFSFFSAGSPFDPPIMGFFMILPFFIHHIHKSESKQ